MKCSRCDGWGCVKVAGTWEYCECPDGYDLRFQVPGYLALANSQQKSRRDTKAGLQRASLAVSDVLTGKSRFKMAMREPGED